MTTCAICGRTVANIEIAIDQEWWPTYWADGKQQDGPVCFECTQRWMRVTDDCELELTR
jgi:hypothetical protein